MSNAYKDNQYDCGTEIKAVELSKTELTNLIEFIEIEFIDSIRRDDEIDNIDYIVSMMNALQKLRDTHDFLKAEEENDD